VPKNLVRWTASFLTDDYTSPLLAASMGIPQGSPLSPILYLFYSGGRSGDPEWIAVVVVPCIIYYSSFFYSLVLMCVYLSLCPFLHPSPSHVLS
jgi:hypothetical protein